MKMKKCLLKLKSGNKILWFSIETEWLVKCFKELITLSKDFKNNLTFLWWELEEEYEIIELSEDEEKTFAKLFNEDYPVVWNYMNLYFFILDSLKANGVYLSELDKEKFPNLYDLIDNEICS